MKNISSFDVMLVAFAVFWLLDNLKTVWKLRLSYEERCAEVDKAVENLYSAARKIPYTRVVQGLYAGIWLILSFIDVVGFVLLFMVVGNVNWIIKILAVIVLLSIIQEFRQTASFLRVIDDEQKLRETLLKGLNPSDRRFSNVCTCARFAASVILLVEVCLRK